MTVKIFEARNLPKVHGVYFEVFSGITPIGTTSTKFKDTNPYWGEEIRCPLEHQTYLQILCRETKKQKSQEKAAAATKSIGYVKIDLASLKDEVVEDWWALHTEKDGVMVQSKMALRIMINYQVTVILEPKYYERMVELVFRRNFEVLDFLADVPMSSKDRADLSELICNITEITGNSAKVLSHIMTTQVFRTPTKEVLFRGNSIASKSLDYYMKVVGGPWLESIKTFIQEVVNATDFPCEVLQSKLEPNADIEENYLNLRVLTINAIKCIFSSHHRCPDTLKEIFYSIRQAVQTKFPGDEEVKYTSVSGFVFLRLFVPALMTPKLFGLLDEYLESQASRVFVLVATVLQKLGNLQTFEEREAHFTLLNPTIVEYSVGLKEFINKISVLPDNENNRKSRRAVVQINFGESVARFCKILFRYLQALVDTGREVGVIRELVDELQKVESKTNGNDYKVKSDEVQKRFSIPPLSISPREETTPKETPRTGDSEPKSSRPPLVKRRAENISRGLRSDSQDSILPPNEIIIEDTDPLSPRSPKVNPLPARIKMNVRTAQPRLNIDLQQALKQTEQPDMNPPSSARNLYRSSATIPPSQSSSLLNGLVSPRSERSHSFNQYSQPPIHLQPMNSPRFSAPSNSPRLSPGSQPRTISQMSSPVSPHYISTNPMPSKRSQNPLSVTQTIHSNTNQQESHVQSNYL
uniref:Uncharacterized protein n=1 Tax=Arcella intermedia TaxID=1963864 RepID=A0A6B2KYY8_9EUKA